MVVVVVPRRMWISKQNVTFPFLRGFDIFTPLLWWYQQADNQTKALFQLNPPPLNRFRSFFFFQLRFWTSADSADSSPCYKGQLPAEQPFIILEPSTHARPNFFVKFQVPKPLPPFFWTQKKEQALISFCRFWFEPPQFVQNLWNSKPVFAVFVLFSFCFRIIRFQTKNLRNWEKCEAGCWNQSQKTQKPKEPINRVSSVPVPYAASSQPTKSLLRPQGIRNYSL